MNTNVKVPVIIDRVKEECKQCVMIHTINMTKSQARMKNTSRKASSVA